MSWRWPPGGPPGQTPVPHLPLRRTSMGASSTTVPGPGAGAGVSLPWCQGQGWGKGSWALRVLPQLGDHHFLLEEEKAPLAPLAAPGQPHVRAQHRLGVGESLPAEQRAAGMRKAAAGPGRARVSPRHRESPPGAAAAVGLAHPARERRTLAVDQGRGPVGDSGDGKRGAGAGSVLLGQILPPPSAPACQHSSVLLSLVAVGSN